MKHFPKFAMAAALLIAPAMQAQPFAGAGVEQHQTKPAPIVERQLKSLTDSLGLSADQQDKVKAILQQMHEATMKLVEDRTLSQDDRIAKVHPVRLNADRQLREILTEEQKTKLDQFEQEPHPEMHADLQ